MHIIILHTATGCALYTRSISTITGILIHAPSLRPTDFPRCLPTKLLLLRYGPFIVTYNTHFYFPAHCWEFWGAPSIYADAISMIQPARAPERWENIFRTVIVNKKHTVLISLVRVEQKSTNLPARAHLGEHTFGCQRYRACNLWVPVAFKIDDDQFDSLQKRSAVCEMRCINTTSPTSSC